MAGSTRRRWPLIVAIIAVVVALLVGVPVVFKAVSMIRLPGVVAREVAAAMVSSQAQREEQRRQVAVESRADLGSDPVATASGYSCELDTIDRGLMVQGYVQQCSWIQISYYLVKDADDLIAKYGYQNTLGECSALQLPSTKARATAINRGACRVPELTDGERRGELIVVKQRVDPEVFARGDWVSVTVTTDFFRRDLGCGFGIPFCARPVNKPAVPS